MNIACDLELRSVRDQYSVAAIYNNYIEYSNQLSLSLS